MVLYSIFRSLGIEVAILPVLEVDGHFGTENPQLGIGGAEKKDIFYGDLALEELQGYLETGKYYGTRKKELMPQSSNADVNIDRRCKLLMLTRQVHGMKQLREFARENKLSIKQNSRYDTVGARVGSRLRPYKASGRGEDEELDDVSKSAFVFIFNIRLIQFATGDKRRMAGILFARNHLDYGAQTYRDGVQLHCVRQPS